jgi:hypothetical protein
MEDANADVIHYRFCQYLVYGVTFCQGHWPSDVQELYDVVNDLRTLLHDVDAPWPFEVRRRRITIACPRDHVTYVDPLALAWYGDPQVKTLGFDAAAIDGAIRRAIDHLALSADGSVVASWHVGVLIAVRMELDRRPVVTTSPTDGARDTVFTPELLDRVFSLLDERGRRAARSVSKAWYRATCDSLLRPTGVGGHIRAAIARLGGVRLNCLATRTIEQIFMVAAVVQRWLA